PISQRFDLLSSQLHTNSGFFEIHSVNTHHTITFTTPIYNLESYTL
ncbi:hypothetical protein X975_23658, partial [Stegodyphus mimosarum]